MNQPPEIRIEGRLIGPSHPPYIVAEMSGNHNGDIERAFRIIRAAKQAGADAIKLQTYTADTITIDHDGPGFHITGGLWAGRTLYQLYRQAYTPWEWHESLFAFARELGITMFSSPFDPTAVDFLESLNTPAYKIASFEAVDLPLIEKAAATGKPLIISTGMATSEEIAQAVTAARDAGCRQLVLLHCISAYPAPWREANLRTMIDLRVRFSVVTGLSDHTSGISVALAAVALGASIVEKHVTLCRADGGPDAAFSLEPEELETLCRECAAVSQAIGDVAYGPRPSERENLVFRRSLYIVKDVRKGERLTADHVRSIRPGYGLPPRYLKEVIGRMAKTDIPRGTPLSESFLE
jgi:N-acetylneuraminate synthase